EQIDLEVAHEQQRACMFLRRGKRSLRALLLYFDGIGLQAAQCFQQEGIDVVVRSIVLNKAVNQFGQIKAAGHMPEFGAQVGEVLVRLSLGHNIEVTPLSQVELAAAQ